LEGLNSEALEIIRGEKPGLGSPELLIEVFDSLTTPDLAFCIHFHPKRDDDCQPTLVKNQDK
jgi:hypothetical protein